jgi:glycosyltransferase involved in cell wall biosynthesis
MVDGRRLQDDPYTGVGRWLACLLEAMPGDVEVTLLTDGRRPAARLDLEQRSLWVPRGLPEVCWLQAAVPAALRGFDGVFHGTFNALPFLRGRPSVVTIHDLSFEHHPEDFAPAKRAVFRRQAHFAARRAAVVTTHTETARRSICDTYRLEPERVVLVPPSVDPLFAPEAGDDRTQLSALGVPEDYIVTLGGARRRGLPEAVAAWSTLWEAGLAPALVVVGSEEPARRPGLLPLGRLADGAWAAVLAGAAAFLYATRFEGFGMPALEAAACGVPVVCARVPALVEVLGDAASWCASTAPGDLASGLHAVVVDPALRRTLSERGLERARQWPSWPDLARVLRGCYEAAA